MKLAWEILRDARIKLSPQGQKLLRADLAMQPCFELLLEHGCYADARRLLAQALPKRRALWWGLACARDHYEPPLPPRVADTLAIVSAHVTTRSEESRRRAEDIGMNHAPDDLTQCLALAAFFSGGSVAAADLPVVAPCPYATGRFVEVGVYLAAVLKDPVDYLDLLYRYLEIGYRMMHGSDPWLDVELPDRSVAASSAAGDLLCTGGRA